MLDLILMGLASEGYAGCSRQSSSHAGRPREPVEHCSAAWKDSVISTQSEEIKSSVSHFIWRYPALLQQI